MVDCNFHYLFLINTTWKNPNAYTGIRWLSNQKKIFHCLKQVKKTCISETFGLFNNENSGFSCVCLRNFLHNTLQLV